MTVVLSGIDQAVVGVNSQIKVMIHYKLTLDVDNWVLSGRAKVLSHLRRQFRKNQNRS